MLACWSITPCVGGNYVLGIGLHSQGLVTGAIANDRLETGGIDVALVPLCCVAHLVRPAGPTGTDARAASDRVRTHPLHILALSRRPWKPSAVAVRSSLSFEEPSLRVSLAHVIFGHQQSTSGHRLRRSEAAAPVAPCAGTIVKEANFVADDSSTGATPPEDCDHQTRKIRVMVIGRDHASDN